MNRTNTLLGYDKARYERNKRYLTFRGDYAHLTPDIVADGFQFSQNHIPLLVGTTFSPRHDDKALYRDFDEDISMQVTYRGLVERWDSQVFAWVCAITVNGHTEEFEFYQGTGNGYPVGSNDSKSLYNQKLGLAGSGYQEKVLDWVRQNAHNPLITSVWFMPSPPSIDSVLDAVVSDAGCALNFDSVDDMASELGYDTPSLAEAAWQGCNESLRKVTRLANAMNEHDLDDLMFVYP